ncbi:uncharacterized protein LOC126845144 [Adelges cooleyi]|uniref:uncharacterized protein LOC126845144 n=1 Tax=Adelges cooleyi TaxID=133065 RepID=UPI00217F5F07|nr:uncharacterized protein LOC126845144 [Adelges cooleyi]
MELNFVVINHFQIIKDVFNDCREWFGRDGQLIIKISDYKFCTYMQNSVDNYDAIMNYITSFDFPQQTIRENWIDFPIFSKVFRGYCNKLGVSVEKFAQERKEATISRRQKEMETIRRDEQFKMSK